MPAERLGLGLRGSPSRIPIMTEITFKLTLSSASTDSSAKIRFIRTRTQTIPTKKKKPRRALRVRIVIIPLLPRKPLKTR